MAHDGGLPGSGRPAAAGEDGVSPQTQTQAPSRWRGGFFLPPGPRPCVWPGQTIVRAQTANSGASFPRTGPGVACRQPGKVNEPCQPGELAAEALMRSRGGDELADSSTNVVQPGPKRDATRGPGREGAAGSVPGGSGPARAGEAPGSLRGGGNHPGKTPIERGRKHMSKINNWAVRKLVAMRHRDEEGQGLAEYGLILALIAVVAIAALQLLGGNISNTLSELANSITP